MGESMRKCIQCNSSESGHFYNAPFSKPYKRAASKLCNRCYKKAIYPSYWQEKKTNILAKRKKTAETKYRDFIGHQEMIYGAVKRFAEAQKHRISVVPCGEFKTFSTNSIRYQELHAYWVAHDYSDDFAPVISRRKFNEGYLVGNIYWGTKRQFGISKNQKAAATNLTNVIREIERSQAAAAQAPKSPEEEAKSQQVRREIRQMKERQEARYREAIGRK
jgi:hypothetical protein